jgi:hypothetical protein
MFAPGLIIATSGKYLLNSSFFARYCREGSDGSFTMPFPAIVELQEYAPCIVSFYWRSL